MCEKRAHTIAPLTSLIGKSKLTWVPEQQKSHDDIKAITAQKILLAFPDFSLEFDAHTDESDLKLGSVIL